MSDYRLYCLDGDGHIHLVEWVKADDADDAVTKTRVEMQLSTPLIAKISPSSLWKRLVAARRNDCIR